MPREVGHPASAYESTPYPAVVSWELPPLEQLEKNRNVIGNVAEFVNPSGCWICVPTPGTLSSLPNHQLSMRRLKKFRRRPDDTSTTSSHVRSTRRDFIDSAVSADNEMDSADMQVHTVLQSVHVRGYRKVRTDQGSMARRQKNWTLSSLQPWGTRPRTIVQKRKSI